MQVRMSFDLDGASCGDLVGFVNAVQAAGTPPDTPVEHVLVGAGDAARHRLEVPMNTPPVRGFGPPPHLHHARPMPPQYATEHFVSLSADGADRLLRALSETLDSGTVSPTARPALTELRDQLRVTPDGLRWPGRA